MGAADTPPRTYVSELRQEQAAATRERVVRAAAELFAKQGYATTTMPSIARRAGVSTETVQNHGPKVELLRAAIAAVSFGGQPGGPVADTDLGRQLLTAKSPGEAARASAAVLATVNASAHGLWMTISEASRADPRLADELARLTGEIAGQTAGMVQHWRPSGWLRSDLSDEVLVQRATVVGSVEVWDRFVRIEGHQPEAYVELLAGMLLDLWMADEFTGRRRSDQT